ncbi:MAG: response regulator [Patescibacteria group bacterium]|jgi:DNA-binding response OmpR family regulator
MKAIKTVLLIEDEESLRRILKNELEQNGIAVLEAENGEIGLPMALENHPDLILLDVIMPKMHGMAVLQKLQTDEWGKAVPVIVLTNFGEDPRVVEAVREGKCTLLSKSDVKLTEIVEAIRLRIG